MRELDYTEILKNRSSLPRRQTLRNQITKKNKELRDLEDNYNAKRQEINDSIADLERCLYAYTYISSEIELLSRAQSIIGANNYHAVYGILYAGQLCYVGESTDVKARALTHAHNIINNGKAMPMYLDLALKEIEDIDFCILEHVAYPAQIASEQAQKLYRLQREAEYINACRSQGVALYNRHAHGDPMC
jgi:DNA repair exonuclease SbcCD ATPase subunit